MAITLGVKVRDKITGFSGTTTGRAEYISGCNQVLVAPSVDKEGKHVEAQWIDEQRLAIVDGSERPITLDNGATPGFDKPAPTR